METENNTAAAIQAGKDAAGIGVRMWREGDFTLSMVPKDCDLKVLDNLLIMQENRAPTPRELAGKAVMRDEQSLILHAIRFRDEHSALFGTGSSYLAVYDYHRPVPRAGEANTLGRNTSARWRRHAAEFKPALSPEWTAWTTNAGKMFSQTEFAEWLEEHEQDLAGPMEGRSVPSPADLRTLALSLKVTADDALESTLNPTTGEYTLVAKREQRTTGSARIPTEFDIAIPIYEGAPTQRLVCKFRMRKGDSGFRFGWIIAGADRLQRQAFEDMGARIAKGANLPLFLGSPE